MNVGNKPVTVERTTLARCNVRLRCTSRDSYAGGGLVPNTATRLVCVIPRECRRSRRNDRTEPRVTSCWEFARQRCAKSEKRGQTPSTNGTKRPPDAVRSADTRNSRARRTRTGFPRGQRRSRERSTGTSSVRLLARDPNDDGFA